MGPCFFFQSLYENVRFQKSLSVSKQPLRQTKRIKATFRCCSVNINATITALYSRGVRSLNCTVSPPWGNRCGVLFHPYVFLFRPLQEGTLTCQPVLVERSWGRLSLIRANVRLSRGAFSTSTFVLPVLFHSVTAALLCLTLLRNRPVSCPFSPTPALPISPSQSCCWPC